AACAALLIALPACLSIPVQVESADPADVEREVTANILTSDDPSQLSVQVLQRLDLYTLFLEDPTSALAKLHARLAGDGEGYSLFALSELSYTYAERTHDRSYYLAAAVYAYALLFSQAQGGIALAPTDPRLRVACELYNRGLAESLIAKEDEVALESGWKVLPFGAMHIEVDPTRFTWGGYRLEHFVAAASLEVHGLRNRYRRAGVGAPLIAGLWKEDTDKLVAGHRRIPPDLRVPVTAFLRIEDVGANLGVGWLNARLELYPADEAANVTVDGHSWPLESETSSALAYTLSVSKWWAFELEGFFSGAVNPWKDRAARDGLLLMEPYRPGRIPIVLVHGTASSPARWADLVNELQIDDRILSRYQIWLYMYNTGNPIGYSAGVMRESLESAVHELDPEGKDAALRDMVVIGHSQGGLLTKLTAVDSGLAFWRQMTLLSPDELQADPNTLAFLKRSLIFTPEPFVKRVIFVCTPQRGSYLAAWTLARVVGSLVKLPADVTKRMVNIMSLNRGKIAWHSIDELPTSIDNMNPGNPFIRTLAALPLALGVHAHSIIAVDGDGPLEDASDGVVRYASAHIAGVDSEKIVRSGHSAQGNPETIEEIRRILLLHLREH
ncbi:MAG TPA: hypothetical protein VEI82_10990, partial [Myxococcota bacterium]|nr:hypothetical protein [Myxococcota bacterium]